VPQLDTQSINPVHKYFFLMFILRIYANSSLASSVHSIASIFY